MYTRNGSEMLMRSSMFWSSSNCRRSRDRVMAWSAAGSQTNSAVGMMPSSATSMPKESSLKRTRYWPVLRFRPTKPWSWSAAWQISSEVMRMVNLTEKSYLDWKDGLHAWQKSLPSDGAADGKSTALQHKKTQKNGA